MLAGGTPVFVDIEADTANIDCARIEAKITPRTRAIMPVSLYGQCADMDAINAIAARHGMAVIEDAAQSFGASYRGRRSTALSTFGATSFFPSKPLGCYGDGGALFTDDDGAGPGRARDPRARPERPLPPHAVGVGGRLDTLQAAVLLAKLPRFDWELERRRALGARYTQRLQGLAGLRTLAVRPDRDCVWGQYTVFIETGRDAVQAALKDRGVPTAVHYPLPLHHQPAYAAYCCPECCPASIAAAQQVLSLPMSADLSEADQDRVVAALRAALQA